MNKQPKKRYFILLSIVICILAAAQVVASNQLIALDSRLEKARGDILVYSHENELLQQKIASASSLTTLSVHAQDQGYMASPTFMTISTDYPVAALAPLN